MAKKKNEKADKKADKTEPVETSDKPVSEDEQLAKTAPAGVAVLTSGGLTMVDAPGESTMPLGYDGFTEDDLVIQRYNIVQKAGDALEKGFTLGYIMSNISEEEDENLRCTPVLYRKGMVLFTKPFQAGAKPICRSNDALKPSAEIETPANDVCHIIKRRHLVPVCENAKWLDDPKNPGRRLPPACNLCFNTIFKREDNGMGFFMSFRSSGIAPWKNFVTTRQASHQNLFHVSLLLSTEDKTNSFGTFKIPRFSDFEEHTQEDEARLVDAYHGFQAMDLDASFDDERNLSDDGEAQDEGDSSFNTSEMDESDKF